MSRLGDWLGGFDRLTPANDVYERAGRGPTRPEPPDRSGTAGRVIAGGVAVAVFAAAAVFAWSAFDGTAPEPDPPVPAGPEIVAVGEEGSILWPARSEESLGELQTDVDRGREQWLLRPERVVAEFAEQVLGWYPHESYGLATSELADGVVRMTLTRIPKDCIVDEDRGFAPCFPATEEITLVQPLDTSEIWAISDVRSPSLTIDATAGQVVTNGESIEVLHSADPTHRVVVGADMGDYDVAPACYGASGEARLEDPEGSIEVAIAPDRETGSDCGERTAGYLFAASVTWRATAGVDPMVGDSSQYVAVTAVPIAVDIPENAPPVGTTTYTNSMGWSVDHPEGWAVRSRDEAGPYPITGAVFSNVPLEDDAALPPGAIEIEILHQEDDPLLDPFEDDTRFPITLADLGCDLATQTSCGGVVKGNGVEYVLGIRRTDGVSPDDLLGAEQLIASLRFPSLESGAELGRGVISLWKVGSYPDGKGTSAWVGDRFGLAYVMRGPSETYVLDVPEPTCGEGQNQTWDPDTLGRMECPDGPDIRYDRFGTPNPDNDPAYREPLDAYPTVVTWNGVLLMVPSRLPPDRIEQLWP